MVKPRVRSISTSSLQSGQETLLVALSVPSRYGESEERCLPLPCASPGIFSRPPSLYFYLPPRDSGKRGRSGLDVREYYHLFLLVPSAIPGPVGEAPTLFGGGLQDPTP